MLILWSLVVYCLLIVQSSLASSTWEDYLPVRHFDIIAHPSVSVSAAIADSSEALILSFAAYTKPILLILTPSHDLLHKDAYVEFVDETGSHVKKPIRQVIDAFPYRGKVLDPITNEETGWARIVFHQNPQNYINNNPQNEPLVFEGAYHTPKERTHHIKTLHAYDASKSDLDIDLESNPHYDPLSHQKTSSMMIIREVDQIDAAMLLDQYNKLTKRSSFVADPIAKPLFAAPNTCPLNRLGKRSTGESGSTAGTCGNTGTNMNPGAQKQYVKFIDDNHLLPFHLTHPTGHAQTLLQRRQTSSLSASAINAGCPTTKLTIFMAAAADCTYVQRYGGTQAALKQILSNWNSASQVYENTFNFALGLIQVKLVSECGPNGDTNESPPLNWNAACTGNYSINQRLSDFSDWRGKKASDQAGLWHLMTACSSGSSIGVAWLGMACAQSSYEQTKDGINQWVSGTGVSSTVTTEWKVVAHEIGHNFGAIHDCRTQDCPATCSSGQDCTCCPCGTGSSCDCGGSYLMNPTDDSKTDAFSACSIQYICSQFTKIGTCLKPPDAMTTIQSNICGNGIKEGDEECDCGSNCDRDSCCTSSCKLKSSAQCSDTNDECCSNCQLKSAGTVCRSSAGICDYQETCDGASPSCPTNSFVTNGTPCNSTVGMVGANLATPTDTYCSSGICTNKDLQCQAYSTVANTTKGCSTGSSLSCSITCQDPTDPGACLVLNGYYLDGTPCGYGGACSKGQCIGGNVLSPLLDLYKNYPSISIPATIVIAVVILGILFAFIRRCCIRRTKGTGKTLFKSTGKKNRMANRKRVSGSSRLAFLAQRFGRSNNDAEEESIASSSINHVGRDKDPLNSATERSASVNSPYQEFSSNNNAVVDSSETLFDPNAETTVPLKGDNSESPIATYSRTNSASMPFNPRRSSLYTRSGNTTPVSASAPGSLPLSDGVSSAPSTPSVADFRPRSSYYFGVPPMQSPSSQFGLPHGMQVSHATDMNTVSAHDNSRVSQRPTSSQVYEGVPSSSQMSNSMHRERPLPPIPSYIDTAPNPSHIRSGYEASPSYAFNESSPYPGYSNMTSPATLMPQSMGNGSNLVSHQRRSSLQYPLLQHSGGEYHPMPLETPLQSPYPARTSSFPSIVPTPVGERSNWVDPTPYNGVVSERSALSSHVVYGDDQKTLDNNMPR